VALPLAKDVTFAALFMNEKSPRRFSRLDDWLAWQEKLHPSAIDLSLDRVTRTLDRLGWRRPAAPVITIGGTNGKGSSVALTARILTEAGYRVGTFTSPHLLRYNERIAVAEREVSDASLIAAFERIDAARDPDTLTFFEFNALAALLVFETAGVDAIVLEVGMGGRLDAVNATDADAALVTSIALDHCDWLGRDVETIGREKAGIFRGGRPAVFGGREMPNSIREVAERVGADLQRLGVEFDWTASGDQWIWRGRDRELAGLPRPALAGQIQFDNAAGVLSVLDALRTRLPITREAIERGLLTVKLPGRFQIFGGKVEWILDVAHNPAAAATLADQLGRRPARGQTIAVCGILGDKDVEGIASALIGRIDRWIVVGLQSGRAVPADQLAERLRIAGANVVATEPDVESGCQRAASLATPGDRIVVFGSFLTVAPALDALQAGRSAIA
jgi:dihydrofolate synthase/folylpolyglutamate synthase